MLTIDAALWLTWFADGTIKSVAVFSTVYASVAILVIFFAGYNL